MTKNNNRFSNKYLKGFLPYLLTSLVPVATLALLGIFFVFTTNIQNSYIIDKQQKDIFANINKVFSNIKTLDLELSKSINSEMFSGDINPAVYWYGCCVAYASALGSRTALGGLCRHPLRTGSGYHPQCQRLGYGLLWS